MAKVFAKERQRFSELLFYFDALQTAADRAEYLPQESGMEINPILRVGAPFQNTTLYFGIDWSTTRRKLELGVSPKEACQDNQLIKWFFNWERRQATLPAISRKWRAELNDTKALIEVRK
jgi:hypothetical protein